MPCHFEIHDKGQSSHPKVTNSSNVYNKVNDVKNLTKADTLLNDGTFDGMH